MIYMYVFPVDSFERTIADGRLKEAYLKGKGVERYTLEEIAEALNNDVINPVTHWVRMIDEADGWYTISSLHIDNLKESGYDAGKVTESDMTTLADKLNEHYLDWYFWESLEIMADQIGIPRFDEANN